MRLITKFQRKANFSPYFPKEHKGQIAVWERWQELKQGDQPFNAMYFNAGVRTGKTALGALIACQEFVDNLARLKRGEDVKPIHIWIVAPTLDLTQRSFEYVIQFIGTAIPELAKYITKRPSPGIRLPNGAKIECKTAENPDSLLGESLDLVIGDEASRFRPEVWNLYLRARLLDRKGKAIFISTPNGKGWFFQEGKKAKEHGLYFKFTSYDNPYNDPKELDKLKEAVSENTWKQEYMAEAQDDAGSVFKYDDIHGAIESCEQDVNPEHFYIIGADIAKHVDFTVFTVIDIETKKVVHIDRFKQLDFPFQKAKLKVLSERYNGAKIVLDSTGIGEPIKDDLSRDGMFIDDFIFSNKSKKELFEKLSLFLEQGFINIPNFEPLVNELETFAFEYSDSRNIKYSAPLGLHDDCVDSLALAVWGLNPGKPGVKNVMRDTIIKRQKNTTIKTGL